MLGSSLVVIANHSRSSKEENSGFINAITEKLTVMLEMDF